ncbi:MAG: hypothetical protein ACLSCW_07885 [Gemmiger formicilis]
MGSGSPRWRAFAHGRNRQNADSITSRSTPMLPARCQWSDPSENQLCCQMWKVATAHAATTRDRSAAAGRSASMGAGVRLRTPIRRFQRS